MLHTISMSASDIVTYLMLSRSRCGFDDSFLDEYIFRMFCDPLKCLTEGILVSQDTLSLLAQHGSHLSLKFIRVRIHTYSNTSSTLPICNYY